MKVGGNGDDAPKCPEQLAAEARSLEIWELRGGGSQKATTADTVEVSVIYANGGQRVWFTYTNWRGETSRRHVAMYGAFWRTTERHPEPQWMLHAFDIEKDEPRIFAMRDIKDVTGDNHG